MVELTECQNVRVSGFCVECTSCHRVIGVLGRGTCHVDIVEFFGVRPFNCVLPEDISDHTPANGILVQVFTEPEGVPKSSKRKAEFSEDFPEPEPKRYRFDDAILCYRYAVHDVDFSRIDIERALEGMDMPLDEMVEDYFTPSEGSDGDWGFADPDDSDQEFIYPPADNFINGLRREIEAQRVGMSPVAELSPYTPIGSPMSEPAVRELEMSYETEIEASNSLPSSDDELAVDSFFEEFDRHLVENGYSLEDFYLEASQLVAELDIPDA